MPESISPKEAARIRANLKRAGLVPPPPVTTKEEDEFYKNAFGDYCPTEAEIAAWQRSREQTERRKCEENRRKAWRTFKQMEAEIAEHPALEAEQQ